MASSSGCVPGEDGSSSSDAAGRDASACPSEPRARASRFPRPLRLTTRRQFQAVYQHGFRASCPSFALFGLPNGLDHSRLGVTVTRRVGGAVLRNRAKRVLRDVFRRAPSRTFGLDLVVNVRGAMLERPTSAVECDLLRCWVDIERKARP